MGRRTGRRASVGSVSFGGESSVEEVGGGASYRLRKQDWDSDKLVAAARDRMTEVPRTPPPGKSRSSAKSYRANLRRERAGLNEAMKDLSSVIRRGPVYVKGLDNSIREERHQRRRLSRNLKASEKQLSSAEGKRRRGKLQDQIANYKVKMGQCSLNIKRDEALKSQVKRRRLEMKCLLCSARARYAEVLRQEGDKNAKRLVDLAQWTRVAKRLRNDVDAYNEEPTNKKGPDGVLLGKDIKKLEAAVKRYRRFDEGSGSGSSSSSSSSSANTSTSIHSHSASSEDRYERRR